VGNGGRERSREEKEGRGGDGKTPAKNSGYGLV